MKRPERGVKAAEPETDLSSVHVRLKPLFGIHPGTYLTLLYAVALAVGLFFLLVYPGLKSRGTYVTFVSRPAGAAVVVDGVYRGATPTEILIGAGARRIEISRPLLSSVLVERSFRGPVFATLFVKPRERISVELGLEDAEAFLNARLQDYADYAHNPGGSSLAETARILTSPKITATPGVKERLRDSLAAAMPFLSRGPGDLSDFVLAEALVAADGGILTPAGLVDLVRTLGGLASARDYWIHWVVLGLPTDTAQELMRAPWFGEAHDRLTSADVSAGATISATPRLAPAAVAGVALRPVPSGIAVLGNDTSPSVRAQTVPVEPVHGVQVRGFLMGQTEVTRGQYAQFLTEEPTWRQSNAAELRSRGLVEDRYLDGWKDAAPPAGSEDLPVTGVSYFAAKAYCAWLASKLPAGLRGYSVRLPSEAEWEWAARGGSRGTPYPGGSSWGDARFRAADQDGPARAGSTRANGYGLHEVMGNVWEWCEDWYAPSAYLMASLDPVRNPANTSLRIPVGSERVVRGGSWANEARAIQVYTRGSQPPSWTTPYTGFRVVLAPPEP